jgi:phosphatidate cytidylyltransferase
MSYLEPRGGQTPSGGRASGQPDAPAPYGLDAPTEEPDPYAEHRRQAAQHATETGPSWNAFTPGPAGAEAASAGPEPDGFGPDGSGRDAAQPGPPPWAAPTAATSTSQAEWELREADEPRGRGRRRAGRDRKSAAKPAGRAGRNLPAAIAVGVSMILVVLASLFVWKPAFLGVIAVAAGLGIWEMVRALKVTGAKPPLLPLVAGGVLMTGLAWYGSTDALILGLLVTVLASLLWRLADGVAGLTSDLGATLLIAVYVPFLLSFGVLLAKPDDGAYRVLITLLAVVLSDTGGYAAGVFFGKHPMAPKISPKKSWEGFGGSVTASAIGSSLLAYFLLDVPFYWGLLFGAVISVVAVLGDLAESMLKRDIGIKDMSNLLPGHGGLMDRLDSILFAVPTAFLLLWLIAPPG